jgi:hypothetical protein
LCFIPPVYSLPTDQTSPRRALRETRPLTDETSSPTDTIDLQDTDAPSAKDHSRNTQTNSTLAPHQAETLREVAQDTADENARSPRLSWATTAVDDSDPQQQADAISAGVNERLKGSANGSGKPGASANANTMQREDNLAVAQNGGHSIRDDDSDTGGDTDESMDDDMMDKISSSPSIEDGGCAPPPLLPRDWPRRLDSLPPLGGRASPMSSPNPTEHGSSSPYLEPAEHLPIDSAVPINFPSHQQRHHLRGEYNG